MKPFNQHFSKIISILFLIPLLHGCKVSSTAITATWTNEQARPTRYDHVVVAPFIANPRLKSAMENELAQSLASRNLQVNMGSNILPQDADTPPDKEAIIKDVKTRGANAILTVSIIHREAETRYVPGHYEYAPYPTYTHYGTFWRYYDFWYPQIYDPGYYVTDRSYFLEANLFDTETGKLIWSAQTATYDPNTIHSFSDDFSRKVARQLRDDGLI